MPKIVPLHWRKLLKIFLNAGFKVFREEGDHLILVKQGVLRPVVIPKYSEVPVFIIKNNIRTSGLSREDYFNFMQ